MFKRLIFVLDSINKLHSEQFCDELLNLPQKIIIND